MGSLIIEIRAGTGGVEAGIFAAELFSMYQRFCEKQGWLFRTLSRKEGNHGELREGVAEIQGDNAARLLRFESGVHRVQRVPQTEKSGRLHTSTATVAVLPKVDRGSLSLAESDLKIETFRASGHGGQSVNKVETAVRITHLPTGVTASCQNERSQTQNRAKALEVLASRLAQMLREQNKNRLDGLRREQIGEALRSEKIRTYHFVKNLVTDHRLGKSFHHLAHILKGNLLPLLNPPPSRPKPPQPPPSRHDGPKQS